jgi:hypothetical protein
MRNLIKSTLVIMLVIVAFNQTLSASPQRCCAQGMPDGAIY